MSEQPGAEDVIFTGNPLDDGAFAAVMGDLLVEKDDAAAPAGAAAPAPAGDGAGQQPAPAEGAGAPAAGAPAPAAGDAGQPGVAPAADPGAAPDAGASDDGAALPDADTRAADWGNYATAIASRTEQQARTEALKEVREAYGRYFSVLEAPTRAIIGQKVPALRENEPGQDADGMITLRDSTEVDQYRDELKHLLAGEITSRAEKSIDEGAENARIVNDSIELFKNNSDLVPGTKQFDKELADQFVAMTKDYQVRNEEGRLIGFSVPVQPLLNHARTTLATQRGASAQQQTQAARDALAAKRQQEAEANPPQEGIGSTAGNSGEGPDDWSTFWGTLNNDGII